MARHMDAWMDGVKLADVGAILIQQVDESPAEMEITYGTRPIRPGSDVLQNKRKSLKVTLTCAIREIKDLKVRTHILQRMAAWASGSILELSNHPDQQLRVRCKAFPALGSVRDYTSEIKIELEAAEFPYWEDTVPMEWTASSSASGSKSIIIPGTAQSPITFRFTPSGAMSNGTLTVTATGGGITKQIVLSGLNVSSGAVLELGPDSMDRFLIHAGTSNYLSCRSMASADDLVLPAGIATVSWVSSVAGAVGIHVRGRWL